MTDTSPATEPDPARARRNFRRLALLTLGVVYGDIGTSPLYALRECFHGAHAVAPAPQNVLGVLSLILWSLIIVISIKYLFLIMRADNRGEGGILALVARLVPAAQSKTNRVQHALVLLALFGAALMYGDGMITPSISVLSAVEGLKLVTPVFEPYILPIAVAVLIALFALQAGGTARMGTMFGPAMMAWFLVIAALGVVAIAQQPQVLVAISPHHGARFLLTNGLQGYLVMGAVFLVVTGGEALYADMGHFGIRPIRFDWFAMVLPALTLNYFGQGAVLLKNPANAENPFYALAPSWGLVPLVLLATLATVIASQAVISGVFSLTRQAVQMGYLPRTQVEHTSATHIGQIYIGFINWLLCAATVGLVLGFRTSSNLAAAYGVAVTLEMALTTILFFFLAWTVWNWNLLLALAVSGVFLVVDLAFFGANIIKIAQGGWFPLAVAAVLFTVMSTWKRGRDVLGERLQRRLIPIETFLTSLARKPPMRVKGLAIYMTGSAAGVPLALVHNLKHNQVLHEKIILLTLASVEAPHIEDSARIEQSDLELGFHRVVARFGFMEEREVPALLERITLDGKPINPHTATFFLSRETLIASRRPGMAMWREKLFALLARNALPATAFFRLPPNRVVEVGTQIEL